ncbi:dickkopf-related protein 3 [Hyperolius riggenbachi]|uniref:dickkopf-related protein 3 n=1 Tax=Hyperolius riggenbachi TaxID=752182 RepID=UPI0035A2C835
MILLLLAVALGLAAASPTRRSEDSDDVALTVDPFIPDSFSFPRIGANLQEMLQEVEQLMDDTQSTLQNAVKEIEAEQMSSEKVALKDLPPNYHNESITETKVGNDTIITKEKIDKETDNKTGSTFISDTVVSSLKGGDKRGHECIVDEDCDPSSYCYLSDFIYSCQPCRQDTCTRDGECCGAQMCVWGQCKESQKGESGTTCESQQDCASGLCCAVHESFLFPVCTPLPKKGEECQNPNPLLDLLTWDLEPEAPLNYCPCVSGLLCQPQSSSPISSVCEEPSPESKREEPEILDLPLFTAMPQEDIMYEEGDIAPTGFAADADLPEDDREVLEPRFVDYI